MLRRQREGLEARQHSLVKMQSMVQIRQSSNILRLGARVVNVGECSRDGALDVVLFRQLVWVERLVVGGEGGAK